MARCATYENYKLGFPEESQHCQKDSNSRKGTRQQNVLQVEGVGTGSLAAAALHADFDLDKIAPWKTGRPVPFAYLAAAFEAIGSDSKRLAKTQQLVQFFRAILGRTPEDLLPAVYLCTNQIAPAHEGTELGIGDAILIKVAPVIHARQG